MLLFTPVPTGEPISTGVILVISVLSTLFRGLFGGGISRNIRRALEGLRDTIYRTGQTLTRGLWQAARAIGRVATGLHQLWVKVLRPALEWIDKLRERLDRWLDRYIRPYLEMMERIRKSIMDIYDRFFRPIIKTIETVRRAIQILKVLRIPGAEKLDAVLLRLEAKIAAPILELLRRTSIAGAWINVLLTARYVIQQPIWTNSLVAYQGALVHTFLGAIDQPLSAGDLAAAAARGRPVSVGEASARVSAWANTRSGPYAASIERGLRRLASEAGV